MKVSWKPSGASDTAFAHKNPVSRAWFWIIAIGGTTTLLTTFGYWYFRSHTTLSSGATQFILGIAIFVLIVIEARFALEPLGRVIESQKRFMANASHELRTPLAVMKTTSEVAVMSAAASTKTEMVEALQSNLEEINRMSERIRNLLRLAHFDGHMQELPFTKVDVAYLVQKEVDRGGRLLKGKQLTIEAKTPQSAFVWGNAPALENLTANLVRNAIKYTPSGGSITVGIDIKNRTVILQVKDTGIGISAKNLPHIFEPFYRAQIDHTDPVMRQGSGLGLALVRQITQQHNGAIHVESGPGDGTLVRVTFPRA